MTISKITKFALVGLVTGMITGLAGADTNTDLQERLANAEARIAELSADKSSNWLNDTRADEIRQFKLVGSTMTSKQMVLILLTVSMFHEHDLKFLVTSMIGVTK